MTLFFLRVAGFFVISAIVVGGSTAIVFRKELKEAWRAYRSERLQQREQP